MKPVWPTWLPLREDLRELSPYGAPQIENVIRLNTNENPFALPNDVVSALAERVESIAQDLNRYPDRDAVRLREKLAGYINQLSGTNLDVTNVWAANGSNEILQTIFLACGGAGRKAIGFTPSYSVHPLIARITGTEWIAGSRDDDFGINISEAVTQISDLKPSLIFITTPNNPTGTATSIDDLATLAECAGRVGALLVVDEAYAEFSQIKSAVTLLDKFPHILISRTMSKAFAFAGVRVGYLLAKPECIDAMLVTRLPYHLSALTQAAAEVALDHASTMQDGIQLLAQERERLRSALGDVGWQSYESAANFLLFSGFSSSSKDVWKAFLDRGVLIRDISLEGYLRVTVGAPEENDRFISALTEIAK